MITEEIKEKIVEVFGYSSEKEIDELFYESSSNTPMDLLIDFIRHCNEFELKEIRQLMWKNGNGLRIKIKGV